MKRFVFLLLLFLFTTKIYSQTLTATGTSNITATTATCLGTYSGTFDIEQDLLVQYSVNSNFANPKTSVYITETDTSGGVISIEISSLKYNTTYYFRFRGTSDSDGLLKTSNSLSFTTLNITQASDIVFSNIQSTQVSLSFTAGGGDNRIVIAKQGSSVNYDPIDGTSYTANSSFGSGTSYNSGNYIISNGTSNSVTVTNLSPGNTYFFKVFEYTGTGSTSDYRTDGFVDGSNPRSINMPGEPVTQASAVNFTSVGQTSFTANWTRGNGDSVIVVAKASSITNGPTDGTHYNNVNTTFGSGSTIDGGYVVYKGTGTSVSISGLSAGTAYHVMAYEYNTSSNSPNYNTSSATNNPNSQVTLDGEPVNQATNVVLTNVTSTSVDVSWTNGADGDGRILVVRADASSEVTPSDGTDYEANASIGSAPTTGAGNFVVYDGTGTSVTVTGLSASTTYHFKVYEYNNSGTSIDYKTDGFPSGTNPASTTTLKGEPSQDINLVFSALTTTSMTVSWTHVDSDSSLLIARASSAIGDFPVDGTTYTANAAFGTSGTELGTGYVLYSGSGTSANITGLTEGVTYYFMVCAYNNAGSNTNYNTTPGTNNPMSQRTLRTEPTTQASEIVFSAIGPAQLTLTWTSGDGDSRIVLAKEGSSVNGIPTDGTTYTANTIFEGGDQIGAGNYVIYNGTGNSMTVTGLTENITYYFKVFEYTNTDTEILFKTDGFSTGNPNDTITPKAAPTIQAQSLLFSNITNTTMDVSWNGGNGDSILIVAKAAGSLTETPTDGTVYIDNSVFGDGDEIATDVFTVYTGTGTSVTVTGLTANTEYTFRAFEFNNGTPYTDYLTDTETGNPATQYTTGTEPTTQASAVSFANTTSTQTDVSWSAGDGDGRIVLAYEGDSISASPVDGVTYTANAVFGSGTEIGVGNFVVALGNLTSQTVTGLTPESEYKFRVFEYSGSGGAINYLTSLSGTDNPDSVTTAIGKPVTQASEILFSNPQQAQLTLTWSSGDGDSRIVLAKMGSAVDGIPTDGTTYSDNPAFGSGDEIGTDNFVVYEGTGNSVTVTGLTSNTVYHFKVFEYNIPASDEFYQTADASGNPASRSTLTTEPVDQVSTISFANIEASQVDLSWTRGTPDGGDNVIVIARESTDITTNPTDGTSYSANSTFGLGDEIGTDHFVIFNGSGTGVTVTGLTPNTIYYFRAFEYDGTSATCNYLTTSGSSTFTTTIAAEPTTQASALNFTSIDTTSYTLNWTRGNGTGILIVGKQGGAVDVFPSDGTDTYADDAAFGSGTDLGSGNFVMYQGTENSVAITGLTLNQQYYFRAFEYSNSSNDIDYLTSVDASANSYTLDSTPTIQTSDFAVSLTGSGSLTLGWTNGSGDQRIVLAKQTTAVDATPLDAVVYTANTAFGLGDELGTDNFVVYRGTGSSVEVTGLIASTTYHFQVFELNNTGLTNYRITNAPITNGTTGEKDAPSTQATNITFNPVGTTSFTINWTVGDGENRIVVMREVDQGTIENPTEDVTYTASSDWSAKGTQLGTSGYYTVFNGTGNSVAITNLSANTTYFVQVFEYNNPAGQEKYNTTAVTGNQTTLKLAPTIQATDIALTNATSSSIDIAWTVGDGDGRIVVARATSDENVIATDGTDYTANSVFTQGDPTGTGNYVVYKGIGTSVTVTGLTDGTSYTFVIYEFNNSGTTTDFNITITDTENSSATSTLGTATWDGSESTTWENADNWTPSGTPASGQSVVIPSSLGNYPSLSSSVTIDNLVIEAGAHAIIDDGGSLTITNDLLLESPSGSGACGALVIPGTGTVSVSGTSTLERYVSSGNWHLVSYPTTSRPINAFTGYFANSYNEANVAWDHLNTSSSISAMQGISVNNSSGSNTITFTGTFANGSQSIGVTNSSPGDDSYGWNLVGNPFPSPIDWDAASGWTLTNVDPTAYYYNSGSGSYSSFNSSSSTGTNGGTQYIASGQGFFVHTSGNGSLGMTNAVRVTNAQSFLKTMETEKQLIRLEASAPEYTDDMVLLFYGDATDAYDPTYDALKLFATNEDIPQVYAIQQESYLAINTYHGNKLSDLETLNQLTFGLGILPGSEGTLTLKASEISGIASDVYIYLYDADLNRYTNLRESSCELFLSARDDDRFQLILSKNPVTTYQLIFEGNIFAYTNKKAIFVKTTVPNGTSTTIHLYDIMGRFIESCQIENTGIHEFKLNSPGTYLVKAYINQEIVTQKVVVE